MLPHSHDALFKLFMQDKYVAQEFMMLYLPDSIKTICDLNSLSIESGSFVEADLTQHFNDILYSVNTQQGKEYIYCLVEHQSKPDKMIAFRLMKYAIMVMENHIKQGNKTLPLVVPLLFYCGAKPHPKSITMNWLNHFDDANLAKQIYNQSFKLIDISTIDDNELMNHRRLGILEYLFKHIRTRDLIQIIDKLNQFLMLELHDQNLVEAVLFYAYNNGNINDPQQLTDRLLQNTNHYKEQIMTFAEYLRQQGEKKGQYNAALSIAKNLLEHVVNIEVIKKSTGLNEEEIKSLML